MAEFHLAVNAGWLSHCQDFLTHFNITLPDVCCLCKNLHVLLCILFLSLSLMISIPVSLFFTHTLPVDYILVLG